MNINRIMRHAKYWMSFSVIIILASRSRKDVHERASLNTRSSLTALSEEMAPPPRPLSSALPASLPFALPTEPALVPPRWCCEVCNVEVNSQALLEELASVKNTSVELPVLGGDAENRVTGNTRPANIEVLSWQPRAFLFRNFLSDEECEHFVDKARPMPSTSPAGTSG